MTTQTSTWHGEPLPPSPSQRAVPGTTIGGRYQLRASIGNGGMGTVWQAADTLLRRDVAVKEVLLPPGMAAADRNAMYERTLREARACAALSHPSVVQVYDVVTEGGRPWIVMELLHARSLAEMIIADGPLVPRAVAKIGIALLGALEVAHSAGVLHRDVKPANVLICTDGRCVLTDFGVARMPDESNLTTPGMVLGSPHFISPERAVGGAFGPPSDLFSLGVSLFTAVEGRPPFDKGDPFDTMRAVVEEPPVSPVRSGPLIPVLYGLLEKDPAQRWDVQTARQALRELLTGALANNAVHHVTDPYAVVPPAPTARPSYPTDQEQDGKGRQIGGRAMLAPGELPTDRAGRRYPTSPATPTTPAVLAPTSAGMSGYPGQPSYPNQPYPDQSGQGAGFGTAGQADQGGQTSVFSQSGPGTQQPGQYGQFGQYGQSAPATGGTYGGSAGGSGPGQPHRAGHTKGGGGLLADLSSTARQLAGTVATRFRALPKAGQVGTAAGLAVLLILVIGLAGGWFSGSSTPVASSPSNAPSAAGPAFPVRTYSDARHFSLSVPSGWKKAGGGSYFDFTDPDDSGQYLRVNVENAGATASAFLRVVGGILSRTTSRCPAPYTQVALRDDVTLSGRPAAELEYTCGEGADQRHGIWRATVVKGSAYEFYLSTEDSKFTANKPVYDEAVSTYKLNLPN